MKRQDLAQIVEYLRRSRADAIANRQRYKEMKAQLVEAFCDGQQAGLRQALFMLVPDGPENDEVMAERKAIAEKNTGTEPY